MNKFLPLKSKYLGITALNPFARNISASRAVMFSNHVGAAISLVHATMPIIMTGAEVELGKTTFSKVIENESKILSIYKDKIKNTYYILYLDLVENRIKYIDIPPYIKNDIKFGFKYKFTDTLLNLEEDDIVEANTVLAEPLTKFDYNGYGFGRSMNVALITDPSVGEDAFTISVSAAKALGFKLYVIRRLSFGKNIIPLNLYGNDKVYKIFPGLGEYIREDGILFATRKYDDDFGISLFNDAALREPNTDFDNVIYANGKGGRVVSIEVINSKFGQRDSFWSGTEDQVVGHYNESYTVFKRFMKDALNFENDYNAPIDDALQNYIVNMEATNDKTIKNLYKKDPLDSWTVDITLEYDLDLNNGYKITGMFGDKGVIGNIIPDDKMPIDVDGNRADIIMDPDSTIGRMNVGRLMYHYITGASRRTRKVIINMDKEGKSIDEQYNYLLGFIKLFDNEQYIYYSKANKKEKIEILNEVKNNELFIYLPADNKKPPYKIIEDIKNSGYGPLIGPLTVYNGERYINTSSPSYIAPMYIMVLDRIGDLWLATSSSKVNHFGIPVSSTKTEKHRKPYSDNPVKTLGETEVRLISAYNSPEAIAELLDRATSIPTHREIVKNILSHPTPCNIDVVVDRNKIGMNHSNPVNIMNSIFKTAGETIKHTEYISGEDDGADK